MAVREKLIDAVGKLDSSTVPVPEKHQAIIYEFLTSNSPETRIRLSRSILESAATFPEKLLSDSVLKWNSEPRALNT